MVFCLEHHTYLLRPPFPPQGGPLLAQLHCVQNCNTQCSKMAPSSTTLQHRMYSKIVWAPYTHNVSKMLWAPLHTLVMRHTHMIHATMHYTTHTRLALHTSCISAHTTHHTIHKVLVHNGCGCVPYGLFGGGGLNPRFMRKIQETHPIITTNDSRKQATTSPFLTLLGAVVSHKELS